MKINERVLMQMNSSAEYSQPCKTDIVNVLLLPLSLHRTHLGIGIVYVQRQADAVVAVEEGAKVFVGQQWRRS